MSIQSDLQKFSQNFSATEKQQQAVWQKISANLDQRSTRPNLFFNLRLLFGAAIMLIALLIFVMIPLIIDSPDKLPWFKDQNIEQVSDIVNVTPYPTNKSTVFPSFDIQITPKINTNQDNLSDSVLEVLLFWVNHSVYIILPLAVIFFVLYLTQRRKVR